MIELTDEQIQSLTTADGAPPRAVNPRTNEMFVPLSVKEYERLIAEDDGYDCDDSPWTREELNALGWEIAERTGWAEIEDAPTDSDEVKP